MMSEIQRNLRMPEGGDVAPFVHFHLDTAKEILPQTRNKDGSLVYCVDGKTRPMLVLTSLSGRERGRKWFLTLPLTTKGRHQGDKIRPGFMSIGNSIDANTESFIELLPHRLPENLLDLKEMEKSSQKIDDRLQFGSLLKILTSKLRKQVSGWTGSLDLDATS